MNRRARSRRGLLLFLTLAISLVVTPTLVTLPRWLVWNASASVPTGLYRIAPLHTLRHGDLVVVDPPKTLAHFLVKRGYLGQDVPLIKRVVALPGQVICRHGDRLSIDGQLRAIARARDGLGRALPVWQGCRVLRLSEVFLLNDEHPASLDGRYFGPVPRQSVVGRAVPIWIKPAR